MQMCTSQEYRTNSKIKMSHPGRMLQMLCILFSLFAGITFASGPCRDHRYDLIIGVLSQTKNDSPLQKTFNDFSDYMQLGRVKKCFNSPLVFNLGIEDVLNIPEYGWTNIRAGINETFLSTFRNKIHLGLSVVVGPFYQNLAMILEDLGVPYVITDYMGFNWSDISLVENTIAWRNTIEVRPPMRELNGAIVDFLVWKKWESAIMIMPESPKDNQECENLARQMVENNISPISYTLKLTNRSLMREKATEVIRNVKLLQQKKMVICSPRDETYRLIELVLNAASEFQMIEDESFSFFILDPKMQLSILSEINMYRTGLFAAKADLFAYRYTDIDNSNSTRFFKSGYAYGAADAAKIVNFAKYEYTKNSTATVQPSFNKTIFIGILKNAVQLSDGETGRIKFDENGTRVDYTLSLYNHGGKDLYKKVATWKKKMPEWEASKEVTADNNSTNNFAIETRNDTTIKETRGILKDVKVVVVLEEPFVMERVPPRGIVYEGNDRFEGFTIDLLRRISKDLKFDFEVVLSPNNEYGAKLEGRRKKKNETWGGIVGEIMQKRATLGMGAISITSARQSVIDFSFGVISTGVNILITKPEEKFNMFQFLTPFSIQLWMAIIGSSFGVSFIYIILDLRSRERVFTIKSTLWFSLGTLLMKGTDFSPKRTSQRILTTGFLFFVLITVSTYTANMAAFLTKKNLEEPIDSFEQLADKEDIKVYTVANSATMNFLKNSHEQSTFRRIWERIDSKSFNGLVQTAKEGRDEVMTRKETTAFIFDSMINSYSEKKYCETKSVSSPILLQEHGIAMAQGAPLKSSLNIEILKLKEEGFIQALKNKWWENTRECDTDYQSRSSKQVSFDLDHTAGVFIVGCFGLGSALALFVLKKAYVLIKGGTRLSREDTSGVSNERSHVEKLIIGRPEGKQSTV